MITSIQYLTVFFIVAVNLFAGTNSFSAKIDRVELISELPQTNAYMADIILFNNKVFFLWDYWDDNIGGLWISDGTETGTKKNQKPC